MGGEGPYGGDAERGQISYPPGMTRDEAYAAGKVTVVAPPQEVLSDLARAKVLFQARAIAAALGAPSDIVELPASEARA